MARVLDIARRAPREQVWREVGSQIDAEAAEGGPEFLAELCVSSTNLRDTAVDQALGRLILSPDRRAAHLALEVMHRSLLRDVDPVARWVAARFVSGQTAATVRALLDEDRADPRWGNLNNPQHLQVYVAYEAVLRGIALPEAICDRMRTCAEGTYHPIGEVGVDHMSWLPLRLHDLERSAHLPTYDLHGPSWPEARGR